MAGNPQIVRRYLDGLVAKQFDALPLAEDIVHVSPFGTVQGRKPFVEACKLVVSETKEIVILNEQGASLADRLTEAEESGVELMGYFDDRTDGRHVGHKRHKLLGRLVDATTRVSDGDTR